MIYYKECGFKSFKQTTILVRDGKSLFGQRDDKYIQTKAKNHKIFVHIVAFKRQFKI